MRHFAAISLLTLSLAPAWSQGRDFTVAADGTGDFTTIQAAVNAVPADNRERVIISIRNGTYNERVVIRNSFLTLRGEDRKKSHVVNDLPGLDARGNELVFQNLTFLNPRHGPQKDLTFMVEGTSTHIVVANTDVISSAGDTLMMESRGEYYLNDVYVSGTYHIIVPRGTTYATHCSFWCLGNPICLFNEGISAESDKMVIRDSTIDGPQPFGLGSYFRDAAWYFIDDRFGANLNRQGQIFRNTKNSSSLDYKVRWGEDRIYFLGSKGPDYPWLKDNLQTSAAKSKDVVTAAWTLRGWDPESTVGPSVTQVAAEAGEIRITFSESVTVRGQLTLKLATGAAPYVSGSGSPTLVFRGAGRPVSLDGGSIMASGASLHDRAASRTLPR